MRNLKRVLSSIMAVAMLMSLVVFSTTAAETSVTVNFKDQDEIVNTEAVDMSVALKIINGYEDGTFQPNGNITRGEMTKMIAVLMHGGQDPVLGTNPSGATFTDIRGHWAEKYIEYCVAEGIVAGMGDGTFVPEGQVTGTQAAKMLLVSLGFRADVEDFNTSNWATRIAVCAADRKLYSGLNIDPNASLSRDSAAQMIWNALQANEVEYVNEWAMDANGNMVTKLTARDRTLGNTAGGSIFISLLTDKYECDEYTATLWETTWDKSGKVFRYTFNGAPIVESTTDYSAFFSMNVRVFVKKDGKTILGLVADKSRVLAEGIVDDISKVEDELSIKMSGTKYRVDLTTYRVAGNDIPSLTENGEILDLKAYPENVNSPVKLDANADVAWNVRLIDQDGNGRVDHAVYMPFHVAKVTYVGTESITVANGGVKITPLANGTTGNIGLGTSDTFDKDDTMIYEGVAKDDYIAIYSDINTPYDMEVIEKMETVSGELTRIVRGTIGVETLAEGEIWHIDGTAYTVHADAAENLNTTALLTNEYDLYQVNGFVFGKDLGKSNYTMDDVVLVNGYELGGDVSSDLAKVYFAKDGSSAAVNVSEIYIKNANDKLDDEDDATGVTNISNELNNESDLAIFPNAAPYNQSIAQYAKNRLFTFTEKNGQYVLEEICDDNSLGFTNYVEDGNGIRTYSKTPATIDGISIADEAVVFMVYSTTGGANNKVKVITGAAAADLATNFAYNNNGYSTYLSSKNGNLTQVQLGLVVGEGEDLPSVSGVIGNFGYIISNNGEVSRDGKKYQNFTIYTKSGVLEVDTDDTGAKNRAKHDVITYSDLGDGFIDDVELVSVAPSVSGRPESGDLAAIAAITGYGGKQVTFQYGGAARNGTGYYSYDDDTVFLLVNNSKTGEKKGVAAVEGDSSLLVVAQETGTDTGKFIDNAVFVVGDNNILKLVVIDETGKWPGGYGVRAESADQKVVVSSSTAADTVTPGAVTYGTIDPVVNGAGAIAITGAAGTRTLTITTNDALAVITAVTNGANNPLDMGTINDNGNTVTIDTANLAAATVHDFDFTVTAENGAKTVFTVTFTTP